MSGRYDDILQLTRPASPRHGAMPRIDRAAQFAPFAALSGYDEAVQEARKEAQEPHERAWQRRSGAFPSFEELPAEPDAYEPDSTQARS